MLGLRKIQTGCLLVLAFIAVAALTSHAEAQKIVDKTVATVSDGIRTELITLSDLRWQLALQPNVDLRSISSNDLKAALDTMIDQRIFALEAKRLPREPVSKEEIVAEVGKLIGPRPKYFSTAAELEARLRMVGFTSIDDDRFQRIISDRIAIEKYLDFRFESFTVITAADEAKYYREVDVPDFRRRSPGVEPPSLEDRRAVIHDILVQDKIATDIETFLEQAKQRVTISLLSEV